MIFSLFKRTKKPKKSHSKDKSKAPSRTTRPTKTTAKKEAIGFKLKKWSLVAFGVLFLSGSTVAFIDGWLGKSLTKTNANINTLMKSAGFVSKDIYLNGHHHTTVKEVLSCLGIRNVTPLSSVDIHTVREKILGLPWVESAVLQRRFPHTLFINIQEKKAIALWQNKKKFFIIDQEGKIITTTLHSSQKKLPVVIGHNAPKHTPKLLKVLDAHPHVLKKVKAITRQGDRRWDIHFKDGAIVKLPEYDFNEALNRLDRFEKKKSIRPDYIQVIDLRLPNQLVIKLTPKAQKIYAARGSHA